MEKEDQSLCVTTAEVLALILHINRLHQFTEGNSCTSVDSLKSQLSEKFKKLSNESNNGSNTSVKDINSEAELLQDLFLYIENGASKEVFPKISKKYQIPKLRYVEKLLGSKFSKHIKRNNQLLDAMKIE